MKLLKSTDWGMLVPALVISFFGLLTMMSIGGEASLAGKQLTWLTLGVVSFFAVSTLDLRFLRQTYVVVGVYALAVSLLAALFVVGSVYNGAQGWLNFGAFVVQPADPAKFALILMMAKYFSRRHVFIAHFRHIFVSGAYALIIVLLLFFQPDFGSAAIVLGLWAGMVLVTGIPFRYILFLALSGVVTFLLLWNFGFEEYQKARVMTFLNPLSDIQGRGYNAYQSTIAVGSAGWFGKGVGYGTQSRLQFLPQHETDFIFASYAEEWGVVGVLILFILFGILLYRLVENARQGATNFESLFILGVAYLIVVHATVHIGGNVGLLPVTGTTLPLMSYGGSHIVVTYTMLGIINAMRAYRRGVRSTADSEIVGVG